MLSRRHSLLLRLTRAYRALLAGVLLLVGSVGLGYFLISERDDNAQSTHVAATMLATQSTAALMFGDVQVLRENLGTLKEIESLRWAAIVPGAVNVPLPVVGFGAVPEDLASVQERLAASREARSMTDLVVRAPIVHHDVERGQLYVAVSLREKFSDFLEVCALALLGLSVAFLLGERLFRRIVNSIVAPLGELIDLTATVAGQAKAQASLENLPRPTTEFVDEVGQLAIAFNEMLDSILRRDALMRDQAVSLERMVEDLRSLSARMRAVREEERTRISHEIHDELGQRLTALKYSVARLDIGQAAEDITAQIDELIRTVRVISWELRPSVLDSLGLVAAMDWQARDFYSRIGIRCGVDLPDDEPKLPAEMATDLFRVFQELLTNVSRHAQASRVDIILEITEAAIHLEVKDDGRGVQERERDRPALGLLGIRERLEHWGGTMDSAPVHPGSARPGTGVRIMIPLPSQIVQPMEPMQ